MNRIPEDPSLDVIRNVKSKHHAWKRLQDATRIATVMYVQHNPKWRMIHMIHSEPHENSLGRCRKYVRTIGGRYLVLLHAQTLPPNMYITIKATCAECEVGHICTKPGHACFRKRCSCLVGVQMLEGRWTGRGIESYIKHATLTWEYFKLKDTAQHLLGGCLGSDGDQPVQKYAIYAITRRRHTQSWSLRQDNSFKLPRSAKSKHVWTY